MRRKYRAEAFIIPKTINADELSTTNEIDDVKIANIKLKLRSPVKSAELAIGRFKLATSPTPSPPGPPGPPSPPSSPSSPSSPPEEKFPRDICSSEEPIYDEPCVLRSTFPKLPSSKKYEDIGLALPPKIPIRTSSLVSIDERGETDGSLEEFCFHGYKNGCTASTQRPEEVSEEIFQGNWLRRLAGLRERESSLSVRETLLQERERLLFKKERELRILERLVREKLKQAELHVKLCQSSQSIDSGSFDARTQSSEDTQRFPAQPTRNSDKLSSAKTSCAQRKNRFLDCEAGKEKCAGGNLRNPPNSTSSLWTASCGNSLGQPKEPTVKSNVQTIGSSFPISSAYSSLRMSKPKIRPRISYDDLDSTLSADIGDSSFVVTSRKFDPAVFKKPQAFVRSWSERRAGCDSKDPPNESNALKYPPHPGFQCVDSDDKILKRTGDNIVVVQDDRIKYQDYGLIDERVVRSKASDDARNSYSSLDRGMDAIKSADGSTKHARDRPISWNEESNEWLRKKRHAYNMATMRMSGERFENKENSEAADKGREKLKKTAKKKDSRTSKFGIFR